MSEGLNVREGRPGAGGQEVAVPAAVPRPEAVPDDVVVFYRLGKKFVDDARSIPEGASDVLYYTLSVGHHTGVIDCFERALSLPLSSYRRIVACVESEEARSKLEGVDRFGEIEIDKSHVPTLLPALRACLANLDVFNEPGKTEIPLDELEVQELMGMVDLLLKVRSEPSLYLTVRRVSAPEGAGAAPEFGIPDEVVEHCGEGVRP